MKDNLVYDTDPAVRSQMNDEVCAIEALPAVSGLKQMPTSGSKGAGFQASLRCFASREHGSCGQKQEPPVHLTQSRTAHHSAWLLAGASTATRDAPRQQLRRCRRSNAGEAGCHTRLWLCGRGRFNGWCAQCDRQAHARRRAAPASGHGPHALCAGGGR